MKSISKSEKSIVEGVKSVGSTIEKKMAQLAPKVTNDSSICSVVSKNASQAASTNGKSMVKKIPVKAVSVKSDSEIFSRKRVVLNDGTVIYTFPGVNRNRYYEYPDGSIRQIIQEKGKRGALEYKREFPECEAKATRLFNGEPVDPKRYYYDEVTDTIVPLQVNGISQSFHREYGLGLKNIF